MPLPTGGRPDDPQGRPPEAPPPPWSRPPASLAVVPISKAALARAPRRSECQRRYVNKEENRGNRCVPTFIFFLVHTRPPGTRAGTCSRADGRGEAVDNELVLSE